MAEQDEQSPLVKTHEQQFALAKAAVFHVLGAIRDDPRKYYLMGEFTGSWEKLTEAAAAILEKPVEEVRERYYPQQDKWNHYVAEMEADKRLLTYCREKNITIPND